MSNARPKQGAMIKGYLWANRTFASAKPIVGPDWIRGTIAFGKQLVFVGAALLVLCIFLPNDSRRWIFVGMGLIVVAVGLWHQRNAQRIFDAAQENAKHRGREI